MAAFLFILKLVAILAIFRQEYHFSNRKLIG